MPEQIGSGEILLYSLTWFWPSWLAIAVTLGLGWAVRARLGLLGRIYESRIGLAGLVIVLFWVYTAIFADVIAPSGPPSMPPTIMPIMPPMFMPPPDGLLPTELVTSPMPEPPVAGPTL